MDTMKVLRILLCLLLLVGCQTADSSAVPVSEETVEETTPGGLSLQEEIAQMMMVSVESWGQGNNKVLITELNPALDAFLREIPFGGYILFASNIETSEQLLKLEGQLLDTSGKYPPLFAIDEEGGEITRLSTGLNFPGNMALGALDDPQKTREAYSLIGQELKVSKIDIDFAPVSDLNTNANSSIGIRCFSDDPDYAAKQVSAAVQGLHDAGILSALKHFPGHGNTATDSHSGLPVLYLNEEQLLERELVPFKAGIAAGCDMIMTAHIQFPLIEDHIYHSPKSNEDLTLPATFSEHILQDILRGELGFEGLIVTDALNMGAIARHFDPYEACVRAIDAGADILLMPAALNSEDGLRAARALVNQLYVKATYDDAFREKIDAAVTRILAMKERCALSEKTIDPAVDAEAAEAFLTSEELQQQEWQLCTEAVTILRNNDVLPLSGSKSTVLLYPYAEEETGILRSLELLKEKGLLTTDVEAYAMEDLDIDRIEDPIRSCDQLILISEFYSEEDIRWNAFQPQAYEEVLAIRRQEEKPVAVLSAHLPYDLSIYEEADVLAASYGGKLIPEEGRSWNHNIAAGLAVLFGEEGGRGKLPVSVPTYWYDYFLDEIAYPLGSNEKQ